MSTAAAAHAPGAAESRLRDPLVLGIFVGAFLGLLLMTLLAVSLRAPGQPQPVCPPGQICGGPPPSLPRLVVGQLWRSPQLGYELEYDTDVWKVADARDHGLDLIFEGSYGSLFLSLEGRSNTTPRALLDERVDDLRAGRTFLDLAPDTSAVRAIAGPNVGFRDGVAAAYTGTTDTPQGPGPQVTVGFMAASHANLSILASAVVVARETSGETEESERTRRGLLTLADSVLNTVRWPGPRTRANAAGKAATEASRGFLPAAVPANGLGPVDVAKAYDIERLWDMGIRGEGQTVAILSLDSFDDRDVARFDEVAGITAAPVERVKVLGGTEIGDGTVEVNLDIDIIRAVAPAARIINYEAPNVDGAMAAIVRQVRKDGRADLLSVSWGSCHPAWSQSELRATEQELELARKAGISVFVASGDAGAYDCEHGNPLDTRRAVDYPSSSPNVVAVGGTLLSVARDGRYLAEAGWEDVLSHGGTGGGLSPRFRRPSWQRAPGVDNELSNGKRQTPDVAATADCDSAFFIVYTEPGEERAEGPGGCGTSAAAPFWAASMALVRQLAEREGVGRLGFVNPVLYAIAREPGKRAFHDVVRGGNRFHNAGPGWDYATGLGSPHVFNLAQAVVEYRREHPAR